VVDKDDKHPRLRILDLAKKEEHAVTPATWKIEELKWDARRPKHRGASNEQARIRSFHRWTVLNLAARRHGRTSCAARAHNDLKISPDGKLVSFAAARDDGPTPHDLWLIGSEGGVARNLTGASLDRPVGNYHWAKDGSLTLLYAEGFRNKFAVVFPHGRKEGFA